MTQSNPFAQAPAPSAVPTDTAPATQATPANPFGTVAPPPVAVAPTQNPATVDPAAAAQAAQYAAYLAAQATAPAPVAPVVDPAFEAWQAQQRAAQAAPVAPAPLAVPPAQFTAPAPVQAAPATAPASSGDPFDDPAPQRPRGPRLRDMYGRLLIIIPKEIEKVNRRDNKTGETKVQDRLTADVVVLDDGRGGTLPIAFGGEPEKVGGRPHDQSAELPYRATGMYISAVGIISQCRDALASRQAGNPRMVLGRLTVGEAKSNDVNPPYLLAVATPGDRAIALNYTRTIDPFA